MYILFTCFLVIMCNGTTNIFFLEKFDDCHLLFLYNFDCYIVESNFAKQRVRWFLRWETVVEWQEMDADGFYVCGLQPCSQSEMLSTTFEKTMLKSRTVPTNDIFKASIKNQHVCGVSVGLYMAN